jgi:penicillin-insensitive murein endopeptidase
VLVCLTACTATQTQRGPSQPAVTDQRSQKVAAHLPDVDHSIVPEVPLRSDHHAEVLADDESGFAEPHPFESLTDKELEKLLLKDPKSLGSMSVGHTSGGVQFNAVQMPEGDMWNLVRPVETWGTQETVDALTRCIQKVNDLFPDTPKIHIGDISSERGGHLRPHMSHQSGRDVDVGYYYTDPDTKWYARADADNLDLDRTWAFVRAMVTDTDVEWIFIDRSIQKLLWDHALSLGEDSDWLDQLFGAESSTKRPIFLHQSGHATHIHVRFYNPIAQETGRRLYSALIDNDMIDPPTYYVEYKAKKGDTLSRIAKKYKTSVKALKKANGLRSDRIYKGRSYKVPRRGGVKASKRVVIPARRQPPSEPRADIVPE